MEKLIEYWSKGSYALTKEDLDSVIKELSSKFVDVKMDKVELVYENKTLQQKIKTLEQENKNLTVENKTLQWTIKTLRNENRELIEKWAESIYIWNTNRPMISNQYMGII